ncbi:hypothetical protein D9615_002203 [Tricholomella constricta]|uniref:DUF4470 domain-containing protein n=1 Tax=Tricholomella constricta TaxID=117010 RepID=A0A8H5HLW4_9AGAR|nr:hypothetical protein D9615_002203 [Tricholomella constricta]
MNAHLSTVQLQLPAPQSSLSRSKSHAKGRRERESKYYTGTLETFMSLGLGSGADGATISRVPCANQIPQGLGLLPKPCAHTGVLACSKCMLVKRQHWSKHRSDCEHPLLDESWRPGWIREDREPRFSVVNNQTGGVSHHHLVRNQIPASDCLRLSHNESEKDSVNRNFKLCFAASGDIRNLIKTVNGLPKGYRGKCDILLNDNDAIIVNQNLVILYALLSAGPSIEESAELVVHLMYSAALTPASAAYLRGCIRIVYGDGASDGGNMSFRSALKTRGGGKIFSMQSTMALRRPMEMFLSRYDLRKGLQSMRNVLSDVLREDDKDRYLASLKPIHRVALARYSQSGILAPFSLDTRSFNQPNRLMYTANGDWLGHSSANPLRGWIVSDVLASGKKHEVDSADIIGCLFFHVKRELMEFARRMKEFHVDIHLTQFDPQVLSKGISIGALPAFTEACFDRIEAADLPDRSDIGESLANWAPLLNRANARSCILMHSRSWHRGRPAATAQSNPRTVEMLVERCRNAPALESRLRGVLAQGAKSPAVIRLLESLDAFVDHEDAFQEYLRVQRAEVAANDLGLRIRRCNRVYPKRFGVSLDAPQQKLPNLSREEFYNLFTIGGVDLLTRFIEFEVEL